MSDGTVRNNDISSLNRHGLVGVLVIFGLFGGLVYWASTAEIAGAVVAPGTVVVESHAKSIQHRDGGIVKEFFVRDEDVVTEGQLLAVLDDTDISANLMIVQTQLHQALVKEARLVAEISSEKEINLPTEIVEMSNKPEISLLIETEKKVFDARKATRDGRVAQLSEQIIQISRQLDGQELQREAVEKQLIILGQELADLEKLYESQLVTSVRITAFEKDIAEKEGERGQLIAAIAQSRATIAERRLQAAQIQDDFLATTLDELQETRRLIAEGRQQKRSALDRISRINLRAPDAGVVHESIVHTIGGVISPGETLMLLVPQDDELLIDVRINPIDIDKIYQNQEVTLRLSSFDQRTTPEIKGKVARMAPDRTQDTVTGEQYYTAQVEISDAEMNKLPDSVKLLPGMPIDVFAKTEDRTVLSYLINPFIEQLNHAMRED